MAMFKVSELHESPTNPRKIRDAQKDAELLESVKMHGVLTALLLRQRKGGGWEIVFGSRRARAAKAAGLTEVPGESRTLEDIEVRELQLVENGQRDDVHPLDEADAYKALVDEYGYDAHAIAAKMGKPITHVRRRLQLVHLEAEGRKAWLDGKIGEDAAFVLARVPAKMQAQACKEAIAENEPESWDRQRGDTFHPVTGDEMRRVVRVAFSLPIADAKFPTDDATLVPAAGACTTCPKRTGAQAELFADFNKDDRCTDPTCWKQKGTAQFARLQEAATAKKPDGAPSTTKTLSASEQKNLFDSYDKDRLSYGSPYSLVTDAQRAKLDKAGTPTFLAQRPDGTPVMLARKEDVQKQVRSEAPSSRKPSAAEQARAKKERETSRRKNALQRGGHAGLLAAFVAGAEKGIDDEAVLRALVTRELENNNSTQKRDDIAKRHALLLEDASTGKKITSEEAIARHVATAKKPALRGLLIELIVDGASWVYDQLADGKDGYHKSPAMLAKALGVNAPAAWKAGERAAERALDAKKPAAAAKATGKSKARAATKKRGR